MDAGDWELAVGAGRRCCGQCQGEPLLPALASLVFISLASVMTSGLETEDIFSVLDAPTSEKPPLPPPVNFQPASGGSVHFFRKPQTFGSAEGIPELVSG